MDYDSIHDSVESVSQTPDIETSESVLPECLPFLAEKRSVDDAGDGSRADRQIDSIDSKPLALPPDLAALVAVWPKMPEHIRAAILALAGTVKP